MNKGSNIQAVPTPFMWLGRGRGGRSERIGARGAFVDAAWSHSFVEDAEDPHAERIGAIGALVTITDVIGPFDHHDYILTPYNIPTFGTGLVENVDQGPNIEILSSKADAPAFTWDFTILLQQPPAERVAARADAGAFAWQQTIIGATDQSETVGALAGAGVFDSTPVPLPAFEDFQSYTDAASLDSLNGGSGWTGPFVARGGVLVKSRTVDSAAEIRAQIANGRLARPFAPPAGWTKLRVALRVGFLKGGTSGLTAPQFAIGLCSGNSAIYGDATTTHFVGAHCWGNFSDWGNGWYAVNFVAIKSSLTTWINSAEIVQTAGNYGLLHRADVDGKGRICFFVDITKGSPNYTLNVFMPNTGSDALDVDLSTFETQSLLSAPTVIGHQWWTGRNIAADEAVDGALNHVNVFWNRSDAQVEISDLRVIDLS